MPTTARPCPRSSSALEADPAIAAAIVPVEKIKGSVLIVSGTADSQIPATVYGELAMDRLKAHDFAYPYQHVVTPGAGHIIDVPYADRSTEISDGWREPGGERAGRRGDVARRPREPGSDEVAPRQSG